MGAPLKGCSVHWPQRTRQHHSQPLLPLIESRSCHGWLSLKQGNTAGRLPPRHSGVTPGARAPEHSHRVAMQLEDGRRGGSLNSTRQGRARLREVLRQPPPRPPTGGTSLPPLLGLLLGLLGFRANSKRKEATQPPPCPLGAPSADNIPRPPAPHKEPVKFGYVGTTLSRVCDSRRGRSPPRKSPKSGKCFPQLFRIFYDPVQFPRLHWTRNTGDEVRVEACSARSQPLAGDTPTRAGRPKLHMQPAPAQSPVLASTLALIPMATAALIPSMCRIRRLQHAHPF